MTVTSPLREITGKPAAARFQAGELAEFMRLGISVSDTETTGLKRGVNGLTELASIRAEMGANGKPKLMAFHQHILPLKPAYRDYVAACEKAKAEGKPLPPYDRAKYEYKVDPRALAVTGTELVRERLDGPITGLRVRGKDGKFDAVKNAVPFYEVAAAFKQFTNLGDHDVYFNAPFDLPFLAEQLRDIAVDDMLRAEAYCHERTYNDDRLTPREQEALKQYTKPYEQLREHEKEALRPVLAKLVDLPHTYTNSALFRCLMYGNLTANGFKARNNLDTVYAPLMSEAERERGDHSALEDVVMAARVALDQAKHSGGQIHTIAELFGDLLHRVDAKGQVTDGPTRTHRKHKDEAVQGDVLLKFSDDSTKLGSDAENLWKFLLAFREVRNWSPGSPEHLLDIDEAAHRITINAERKNPLSLNFLKKCAYYHQLLKDKNAAEVQGKNTVIQSIQPFDSTGTVMDVVLRKLDGTTTIVKAAPFHALRANTAFLEAHPEQAEDHLNLIRHLTQCDASVGTVLLSEANDGSTRITVKGHVRGFGECVLSLPPRADVAENISTLTRELETQLKLGAILGVSGFEKPDEEDGIDAADDEEVKKSAEAKNLVAMEKHPDGHVTLALSANVFAALAMRLNQKKQKTLPLEKDSRITTEHGAITITYDASDKDYPRYRLSGQMDALHDFVDLDHDPESAKTKEGRKPATLIRDASWLLYRLEQLPGTYHARVDGRMVVLAQRDGVDTETLNMLYRLKIPFKAYDREIKLDLAQLMENAFHWSVELKRSRDARNEDLEKPLAEQQLKPPRLIEHLKQALYSGNAKAIEMNERQQFWLLDHSKAMHGQPQHHAIANYVEGVKLTFNEKKQLIIEHSDVRRDDIADNSDGYLRASIKPSEDGQSVVLSAPSAIVMLVAHPLNLSPDPAQPQQLTIPIAQEAIAQKTLDAALRYTYWLSKATGSERQTLKGMALHPANQQVRIKLPELALLAGAPSSQPLRNMHHALSQPELGTLLKTLREGLPDVRFASARDTDLHQLTSAVRPQIKALQRLHAMLDTLVSPSGAMGGETTKSIKPLDAALDTLGLLLHEMASLRNARKDVVGSSEATLAAIADAQEKLSNVVFGLKHLREDIDELNKSIVGSSSRNSRALLHEQGEGMAFALVDEARAALRANPNVDLMRHLQPYLAQIGELLGVGQGGGELQIFAQHALQRYLESTESKQDKSTVRRALMDCLLAIANPEFDEAARARWIKLYFSDKSAFSAQEAYVAEHRPYTMSQDAWRDMLSQARGKPRKFLGTERENSRYEDFIECAIDRPITGAAVAAKEFPDYASYQQRKTLLNAMRKAREEVIDLDHALPHALRALNRLAAMLEQETGTLSLGKSAIGQAVREVLEPISIAPATLGMREDPIACIREQIAQQKASIQTNFLGLLARNKITPHSTDDGVTLASADMIKLFGIWQRLEKSGKLAKSIEPLPREQRDTIRELHPLTLAHEEISKVTLNVDSGHAKLRVRKPDTEEQWTAIAKSIEDYAKQHQLRLPEMPAYADMHAVHEVYLTPLTKSRETPKARVAAKSVAIETPPHSRLARLRQAIKAVDLPEMDDWSKTASR